MAITKSSFGITNDGEEAFLYRLENTSGAYVTITSFGCRVVNICVPDKTGTLRDVCLGYDTLAEYEKDQASLKNGSVKFDNTVALKEKIFKKLLQQTDSFKTPIFK